MSGKKKPNVSAEELERIFDEGKENIFDYAIPGSGRHPNLDTRRVNVDFPEWMIAALDHEAARIGTTRQSVIKTWIAEKLDAKLQAVRTPEAKD